MELATNTRSEMKDATLAIQDHVHLTIQTKQLKEL